MLEVGVVSKRYKKINGIDRLVGYDIVTQDGARRTVSKEMLIQRVREGQIRVVNMTLSTDGRLIGSLKLTPNMFGRGNRPQRVENTPSSAPVRKAQAVVKGSTPSKGVANTAKNNDVKHLAKGSDAVVKKAEAPADSIKPGEMQCIELYTCGKSVVGMLFTAIEGSYYSVKDTGGILKEGTSVCCGVEAVKMIKEGLISNISLEGKNMDLKAPAKKKSFKSVLNKYAAVSGDVQMEVEKFNSNPREKKYLIKIQGSGNPCAVKVKQMIAQYAMCENKNRVTGIDGCDLIVEALDGISEVRKALKAVQ